MKIKDNMLGKGMAKCVLQTDIIIDTLDYHKINMPFAISFCVVILEVLGYLNRAVLIDVRKNYNYWYNLQL